MYLFIVAAYSAILAVLSLNAAVPSAKVTVRADIKRMPVNLDSKASVSFFNMLYPLGRFKLDSNIKQTKREINM